MTPNQCLNQPSSEKLPSAVDGNSYRDPQLDSVERERDFGISSPKWDVFITFLPQRSADCVEDEARTCRSERGGLTPRKHSPPDPTGLTHM